MVEYVGERKEERVGSFVWPFERKEKDYFEGAISEKKKEIRGWLFRGKREKGCASHCLVI